MPATARKYRSGLAAHRNTPWAVSVRTGATGSIIEVHRFASEAEATEFMARAARPTHSGRRRVA